MEKFKTGEIIKAICKEMNLTNKQVADIISMTPQNVSRLFSSSNLNTETIDRLTQGLKVNIYAALAKKWEDIAEKDPEYKFVEPEGEFFKHTPKHNEPTGSSPRVSLLIEIDADKQSEILKILKL